jgi:hypothetical protein
VIANARGRASVCAVAIGLSVVAACSSDAAKVADGTSSTTRADQRLTEKVSVLYDDTSAGGADHQTRRTVEVPIESTVTGRQPSWTRVRVDRCGVDGSGSLTLQDVTGRRVRIGESCFWDEDVALTSPDGRYLVAWLHLDGAAANPHLISLGDQPADRGEVPNSTTDANHAAWTRDGHLWFAANALAKGTDRIWSYDPDTKKLTSLRVHGARLVEQVDTSDATAAAVIRLGEATSSTIEDLPVPETATRTKGRDTCAGVAQCREEYWRVPGSNPTDAVSRWYLGHLRQTGPWHDWHSCVPEDVADRVPQNYQWAKPNDQLLLIIDDGVIHIRDEPGELPCN